VAGCASTPFLSDVSSARDNRGCDRVLERVSDGPASPGATPIENVVTARSAISLPGWSSNGNVEGGAGSGLGLWFSLDAPILPKITSRLPRAASSQGDLASDMGPTARYPATASDSCGGGGRAIIVGGGREG
jgi:hypothetical protein